MATMNPTDNTGFNLISYKRTAEESTYQKMVAIPIIEDYGQRLFGTGTVRKTARMSSTVLAQNASGSGLTGSTLIAAAVTLTAAGNYVAVFWSENEQAQIDLGMNALSSGEVTRALAEGSDTTVLTAVQSLTNTMSQASVDGPMWRQAVGRLAGNTNGMAMPGGDKTIYGIFSHTQYPNLGSIPEFNNAEVRGDSENPYVKGIWMRGGGVLLNFSTAVAQDANGWHNVIFVSEAFVIGWNTKTQVETQKFDLQNKVITYNNFGSGVQHDLRAIALRTTASAL